MKSVIKFFWQPHIFGLGIAVFCIAALSAAFTAQYGFNMAPCVLCIYQRIPFAINVILGLVIYKLAKKKHLRGAALMLVVAGVVFIINSALAFYHVGVEQLWWESALEGCKFDPTKIREAAFQPPVPCNIIPWQDPVIGLSMAGWNVVVCGVAGIKSLICAYTTKKTA